MTDAEISRRSGVSVDTLGRITNTKKYPGYNPQEDTAKSLGELVQEIKREEAGYGAESPARKREQLIGALHTMSDLAISRVYDDVLNALRDDMNLRYSPPDDDGEAAGPIEISSPPSGGLGGGSSQAKAVDDLD